MGAELLIDPRLPALVEIEEPNRQQLRRVARANAVHPVRCSKCHQGLALDDVCFADGKDCHRSCAETWNAELLGACETLKEQDACAAKPNTTPDALALTTP